MSLRDKQKAIEQIRKEILKLQTPLARTRRKNKMHPVIGEGSLSAKIVFVGEAPGKNEAMTGRPFVGAAGKVLDQMLSSIGLKRQEIYITNIVNDRPPGNRDPKPQELKVYSSFLYRQLEIIRPKIIVTLGRIPMAHIMKTFGFATHVRSIGQIHGKPFEVRTSYGRVKIVPFYHPAAVLYNRKLFKQLAQDFRQLRG